MVNLVVGKVMVQITPETISNHMKDKAVIMNGEHGFMKGKSCYNMMSGLTDEKRAVDVV